MLISTLMRWDPATIGSAVARFAAIAQDMWVTQTRLNGPVGAAVFVDSHWEGSASTAAQHTLAERSSALTLLTGALDEAQIAVGSFASAIDAAQREVSAALAAASGTFAVSDQGYVSLIAQPTAPTPAATSGTPTRGPTPTPTRTPTPTAIPSPTPGATSGRGTAQFPAVPSPSPEPADALAAQLGGIANRIGTALAAADSADLTCANALHDVQLAVDRYLRLHARASLRTAETLSMPPLQLLHWLMTVPPTGTSPDEVATWWAAQDDDTQTALIAAHPDQLGNLDGLPPEVRDRANRLSLARHIAELQSLTDDPRNAERNAGGYLSDRLRWYRVVQSQLDAYSRQIDPRTGQPVHTQLLMLDQSAFSGVGRAAIAFGDVGSASNVSYLIPGLNQKVDPDLGRTVGNAWNLYRTTGMSAPTQSGAVVAWLGYETPGFSNVAWDNCAEHGADRLRDELDGLHVVRGENQPHLTVIGHSYGSTTAALAARRYDLTIDDLVLAGSPGATVHTASDLHVPNGHVWDGAASGDMVSWLRWFGNVDPSTDEFGAHRFEAETVTRSGDGSHNTGEHSHYFDHGSESLGNITRIVLGQDGAVVAAPYREDDLVVATYGGYLYTSGAEHDPEVSRPVTTTQ
ncbi:MAG: hypothetical protein QOK14_1770 [Frankiaceae bacterium]|nr:hypothetical protein [Frankiaceae bacterium]